MQNHLLILGINMKKIIFRIELKDGWNFETKTLKECVDFLTENEKECVLNPINYRVEQFNTTIKKIEQGINAKMLLRIFKEKEQKGENLPLFISDIKTYL